MRGLIVWCGLLAAAGCAVVSCVGNVMADAPTEYEALQCARTLDEPTDANIVRCFTDRGLPAPEDLT